MKNLIDLHTHTISSGHAYSTFNENAHMASVYGLKYYGMSDHGPICPGGPHRWHFNNMKILPKEYEEVQILKGVEANFSDLAANLDLDDKTLASLDYVIGSIHSFAIKPIYTEDDYNRIYLKACDNPYIKVLGHPESSEFPIDFDLICDKASKTNTCIELNASSLNPGSSRLNSDIRMPLMIEACKRHHTYIIIGSDAHICFEIGQFDKVYDLLEKADFPDELVVNYNEDLIQKLIISKKTLKG